ncbi:rod shape-determining protein MreD [Neobacillus sp. LXY-1]|uniref:rod shape-determining protein MreD n=1 Tax=Neobacillus sp. LXY-1 TaxID=3379133 RepID=UPI003EE00365
MKKFLLPLLFLVFFIAESLFVQFLPAKFFGFQRIFAPHFLFIGLVFLTIFVGRKQGIIYGAVFGLLYDIVYVEVLGIYFFLFPFICYLVSKVMHVIHANLLTAFLVSLMGMALLEIGVYEMDTLIHITGMDFINFLNLRFYPTLLLNVIFLGILCYPLKSLFEKYALRLREE